MREVVGAGADQSRPVRELDDHALIGVAVDPPLTDQPFYDRFPEVLADRDAVETKEHVGRAGDVLTAMDVRLPQSDGLADLAGGVDTHPAFGLASGRKRELSDVAVRHVFQAGHRAQVRALQP